MPAETEVKQVLQLVFLSQAGRAVTFRIPDPKEDLTSEEILEVMQLLVERDVFLTNHGRLLAPDTARIVETITDHYEFEDEGIDVN